MKIIKLDEAVIGRGNYNKKSKDENKNENSNENMSSLLYTCIKRMFTKMKSNIYNKFISLPFHIQLMLIFIPAFLFLIIILISTHLNEYENKFATEYTNIYKSYFSDNKYYKLKLEEERMKETSNNSFKNLIFMKIYTKEMIMKNVLDKEIFNNSTNSVYFNVDILNNSNEMSYLFNHTIDFDSILRNSTNGDSDMIYSYGDTPYNFDNLIKNFLLFSSLHIQNDYFQGLKQMFTYFVITSSDSSYQNYDYSYYPKIKDIYSDELYYDPYLEESSWLNVMIKDFISSENLSSKLSMATSYEDIIFLELPYKEFYYSIMQFKFPYGDSNTILSIASKYALNVISQNDYEGYSFISLVNNITNFSYTETIIDEYRVIGSPPVIPIGIPEIYHNYYRKGLLPVDKNFRIFGYNSDIIDFTKFNQIDDYYQSSFNIRSDSLPYDIIYLYNSFNLMIKEANITYSTSKIIEDNIIMAIPPNHTGGSDRIKNLCQSFNTTQYIRYYYLRHWDFDCMAKDQLKIYQTLNQLLFNEDEEFIYEYDDYYLSMPKCECLPFYCFDLNNLENPIFDVSDIINSHSTKLNLETFSDSVEHFIYADRMFLPTKCKMSLIDYKQPINSNSNLYTLEFHIGKNGLIFNPNMSYISMYIISDDSNQFHFEAFSLELKNLILTVIKIYSVILISLIIFFSFLIYKKFQIIQNKITDFIQNHKSQMFSFDKVNKISLSPAQKDKAKCTFPENQNRSSILLKKNSFNSSNSIIEIISDDDNPKLSNIKFLNRIKENKILKTIKENEEIENDESALIDRNLFSAKKLQLLGETNIEKFNDISVMNKSLDINLQIEKSPEGKKIQIELLPNDCVINEFNITINSDDSSYENESINSFKRDKELINTHSHIPSQIKKNNSRKIGLEKYLSNKEFNDLYDVIKACKYDELDELLNLINLNSFLFRLDTDIDKNFYQEEMLIKIYEKRIQHKKKFLELLNIDSLCLDEDYVKKQENSKSLLLEVISTEFCKFENMSFNFGFKYLDNEEILNDINITNQDVQNSIFLDDYIEKIDNKLKLLEKNSLLDNFSLFLESKINEDLVVNENELLNFKHIKSTINYYLENIFLAMLKKIYLDKIQESQD